MTENCKQIMSRARKPLVVGLGEQTANWCHVTHRDHVTGGCTNEPPLRGCLQMRDENLCTTKYKRMGRKPKSITYEWTEEKEEMLISFWEENEFLYNLACKDYKNQDKKQRAYETIASKIGTTGKTCH